ncbi:MAG: hypothetical protein WCD31_02885 [Gillisia sp.]
MKFPWHLYVMAALYAVAGVNHFIKPALYLRIMPPYLPAPGVLVSLSGIAEILLGILLCFPSTKNFAIYAIIAMLIVFLPVHLHMLSSEKAAAGLPQWALWSRIPLQFLLMFWAYQYLKF